MIKKIAATVLITSFATASITRDVQKKIELMPFMQAGTRIVSIQEEGPFYFVETEKRKSANEYEYKDIFITKDFKYYIVGEGYKYPSNEKIKPKLDISSIKKYAAFTLGDKGEEYYVFTAIDWHKNRKFDPMASEIAKKGAVLHYYFLVAPYMPKKTIDEEAYILSLPKEKRYKELLEIEKGKLVQAPSKKPKLLEKYKAISKQLGIDDKLTIIDKSGKKISCKELLRKYGVQKDIDEKVIEYIEKEALFIKKGKGKKMCAIFVDIEKTPYERIMKVIKNCPKNTYAAIVPFAKDPKKIAYILKNGIEALKSIKKADNYKYDNKIMQKANKAYLIAKKIPVVVPIAIFDNNGKYIPIKENR